jgi:hypothetical protein
MKERKREREDERKRKRLDEIVLRERRRDI